MQCEGKTHRSHSASYGFGGNGQPVTSDNERSVHFNYRRHDSALYAAREDEVKPAEACELGARSRGRDRNALAPHPTFSVEAPPTIPTGPSIRRASYTPIGATSILASQRTRHSVPMACSCARHRLP